MRGRRDERKRDETEGEMKRWESGDWRGRKGREDLGENGERRVRVKRTEQEGKE
jgi:hypothetical protein